MSARSLKKSGSSIPIKEQELQKDKPQQTKEVQEQVSELKLKQQQYEQKQQYYGKISKKLKKGREMAQRIVNQSQQSFNFQILQGKYEIKEREWSASDDNLKNSRSKLTASTVQLKKDLEGQLVNLQSRINEENKEKGNKMMSEEEHQNFMKKIEQQWKQHQKKRLQTVKQQQKQKLQEEKRQREQSQRLEIEKKNKKKQELLDKFKILEEQRKKQIQAYQQQQQVLKQKMAQKTMAQKIQNQFNHRQNDYLEEKKKKLAQIRALHKPIDKTQLDSFSQKLDQLHLEKQQARNSKKVNGEKAIFYKSAFYKKAQHQEKKYFDASHEDDTNKLKQARDKLKRYSDHVKNDFQPTIDDKKVEEIKFRSQSMKNRSFSSNQSLKDTPRKLGLRYLQYNKINHKLLSSSDDQMETEEELDKKVNKFDYLAELRQKNKKLGPFTAQHLIQRLDKKNVPKDQKAKYILEFTQRIQQKAKRREEVQKMGGGVSQQLDSLYLQAIEAKLSLLQLDHQ